MSDGEWKSGPSYDAWTTLFELAGLIKKPESLGDEDSAADTGEDAGDPAGLAGGE